MRNGDELYTLTSTTIGNEDGVRGTTLAIQLIINNVSGPRDNGQFSCNAGNGVDVVNINFQLEIECKSLIIETNRFQYLIEVEMFCFMPIPFEFFQEKEPRPLFY